MGAQVKSVDKRTSDEWMIVHFCAGHNNARNGEHMFLDQNVPMLKLVRKKC